MILLALGLVLFLGVHLIPTAPSLRARWIGAWGEPRYRGLFALASFAGLALIVVGYYVGERGAQLFAPWPVARAIAPEAMAVSFVLFAAAEMRGHIRRVVRHPMLIGLMIWSLVHLLANGDARGTLLFGAFLAYSIVDLISATARGAVKTFEPVARHDVIAVVAGLAFALAVMAAHRWLFGVPVVSFGF
jgi:uncharacterized membrane protein